MQSLPKPSRDDVYSHLAKSALLAMAYGGKVGAGMAIGLPDEEPRRKTPSDQRFRSFAERWVAARCHLFRQDFIQADTWECVQQAKTAYKMIHMVGTSEDLE